MHAVKTVPRRSVLAHAISPSSKLQWLLGKEVSVDDFFKDFWEQKPLHIRRGQTVTSP